jgi:hypothetical protein
MSIQDREEFEKEIQRFKKVLIKIQKKIQEMTRNAFFLDIREAGSSSNEEVKLPLALSLSPPKTKTQIQKTKRRPSCGFVLLLTASR